MGKLQFMPIFAIFEPFGEKGNWPGWNTARFLRFRPEACIATVFRFLTLPQRSFSSLTPFSSARNIDFRHARRSQHRRSNVLDARTDAKRQKKIERRDAASYEDQGRIPSGTRLGFDSTGVRRMLRRGQRGWRNDWKVSSRRVEHRGGKGEKV